MKRTKRALLLGIVLIAACAATFALTRYEEKQEQIKNSDAIIVALASDTVQSLSWEYDNSSLSFHKANGHWLYDGDEAFPVNEEKINNILSLFEAFGAAFIIEEVEDYTQYGLKNPECTIRLSTTEKEFCIYLGDFSKMDEQRYVDIGDGNVYLVRKDPMDSLETTVSSFLLHDSCPELTTATGLLFSGNESGSIIYLEDSTDSYSEEDVYYMVRDGKNAPLDTDIVTAYLSTISSLTLQNFVTYNATEEELISYGLNAPEHSVTIEYPSTDENGTETTETFTLHISRNPEELAAAEAAEAEGAESIPSVTKYIRVNDSQIVYQLSDADYTTLTATSYNDFRHQEVFWGDYTSITAFDITLEETVHTIFSQPGEEDSSELLWFYQEQEIDVSNLKYYLRSIYADSFTDETPTGKEELRLTLHLEHTLYPEIELCFYRYDGSSCLVTVNGESVCYTTRSSVINLIEAVQKIVLN